VIKTILEVKLTTICNTSQTFEIDSNEIGIMKKQKLKEIIHQPLNKNLKKKKRMHARCASHNLHAMKKP